MAASRMLRPFFAVFLLFALLPLTVCSRLDRRGAVSRSIAQEDQAAQQVLVEAADPGQQKYALVIGNGAYRNITKLNNPVNDARDIEAALKGLGFTVETVINGSLDQMESAAVRLKNRLGTARNSYGFFFYAGHGVQSNGENYLIPVDVNIESESFLRRQTISVQEVLDELNEAGNALNVVVLDACRDNPFSWGRSGTRGLQVIGRQPADSIIVYATSAGRIAADGEGRNGLFTTHLLNNLKKPGLEVTELFRLTGADVRRASDGAQIPAIYSQFFETAYLGNRPAVVVQPSLTPAPVQPAPDPEVSPQPTPKSAPVRNAQSYFDSGELFRSRNDYVTAIEEYTQAIRLDPNYAVAYSNRGLMYNYKGDYDQGIADCTQAIRLDPNMAAAYNNRGLAYYDKKDYNRAIVDYEAALRIDPNFTLAKNNLETARKARVPVQPVAPPVVNPQPAPANMVRVEGGTFQMGSTNGDSTEKPVHTVTVKGFYMGRTEVTQKEWQEIMGSNPSNFKGDNLPVERVSWNDAIEYCNRRSLKEGLTPAYRGSGNNITCDFNATGYRLPTEAEWEYAAKGGNQDYLSYEYAGGTSADSVAWYYNNSGSTTHPVGTKQPNSLGLYDMSGNVYEWCWDWYGNYSSGSQTNPTGASSGPYRVFRGGSWGDGAAGVLAANRGSGTPSDRYAILGFRLVRP
jgi:formylglycine-generating enzyme required for sulfatase activity